MRFTINVIERKPAYFLLLERVFLAAGNRQSDAGCASLRKTHERLFTVKKSTNGRQGLSATAKSSFSKFSNSRTAKIEILKESLAMKRYKS